MCCCLHSGGNYSRVFVPVDPDRVCIDINGELNCNVDQWRPVSGRNTRSLVVSWNKPIHPSVIVYRVSCQQQKCQTCNSWHISFWRNSSLIKENVEVSRFQSYIATMF